MAHRQFTDADGVEWNLYDVVAMPGFGRPDEPQLAPHSEQFRSARSWLVFESPVERRRFPSIPDGWLEATVDDLRRLRAGATTVSKHSS